MAFNDDAVIKISTAYFYTADVGTAAPENPVEPGPEWENVGHTPLEDILQMTSEGGEKTTLGSLQNRNLKNSYSPKQTTFNFAIHQFDTAGLKLYLGSNAVEKDGRIGPHDTPQPTSAAWLVVIIDGGQYFDFYVPKADILGADDIALADTESLSSLPLAVTPLRMQSESAAWFTSGVKSVPGDTVGEGTP